MTIDSIQQVPLRAIAAGDNDRKKFDTGALTRLADTMADHGLLQPVTLRTLPDGRFEVVAGERRFRAATLLGWDSIPAVVRDLDDSAASTAMLVENTGRVDLDPIEEGHAYAKRIGEGMTVEQVARLAGVTAWKVNLRLQMLDLVDEAQQLIRRGDLPLMMAQSMHGLDRNRQRIALRALGRGDITPQSFRDLTARLRDDQHAEGQEALDFDLVIEEAVEQSSRERNRATRADLLDALRTALGALPEGEARDAVAAVIERA